MDHKKQALPFPDAIQPHHPDAAPAPMAPQAILSHKKDFISEQLADMLEYLFHERSQGRHIDNPDFTLGCNHTEESGFHFFLSPCPFDRQAGAFQIENTDQKAIADIYDFMDDMKKIVHIALMEGCDNNFISDVTLFMSPEGQASIKTDNLESVIDLIAFYMQAHHIRTIDDATDYLVDLPEDGARALCKDIFDTFHADKTALVSVADTAILHLPMRPYLSTEFSLSTGYRACGEEFSQLSLNKLRAYYALSQGTGVSDTLIPYHIH